MPNKSLKDLEAENKAFREENAILKHKLALFNKLLPVVFIMELTGDGNGRSSQLGFWNNELGIMLDFSTEQMAIATCDGFEGLIVESDRHILDDMLAYLVLNKQNTEYSNAIRFIGRNKQITWLLIHSVVISNFDNGRPQQILCSGARIDFSLVMHRQLMMWIGQNLTPEADAMLTMFTKMEKAIIRQMFKGDSSKMIAEHFFITKVTVDRHVQNIHDAIKQNNMSGLIGCLCKNGLAFWFMD